MPGLGTSFGRGAATTYLQDLENSDCILIMGSNMAEAHPVGFRWPMKAKAKGAQLIHVDPRFTRTSAMTDHHVQIRAGSDIAFLGAIIHYVLENERWFPEYVKAYTNAALLVDKEFEDTEQLDGLFSQAGSWAYQDQAHQEESHGLDGGATTHDAPQKSSSHPDTPRDESLQHPRCVLQVLKRHFRRYTAQRAAEICGCTAEEIERVAKLLCDNSGRERTSAICYAVGWTQHSTGVQIIRAAGILQLLLGNIGRPGGGIMALRGHASIQGSTDVPTLYDLLPGYLPQPTSHKSHDTLDGYVECEGLPNGYWTHFRKFAVSLLKAWYGDKAHAENDFLYSHLPRIDDDYSMLPMFDRMTRGKVHGYFLIGQNPAAGSPNSGLARAGLRKLKWLVVMDWFETDSAVFWKADPTGPPATEVGTEVFFLPAACSPEKEGSLTNTQRLLQWHDKAVEPPEDCRSDLWWIYQLGNKLRQLYAGTPNCPLLDLTWDYGKEGPDAKLVLQEINGKDQRNNLIQTFDDLKDDGSTSCGCWIYSGVYPKENRARERTEKNWGFAWPKNRRILYNRASADPEGRPWSERKKYVYWDGEKWTGKDVPDFEPKKSPDYRPSEDAKGMDAIAGDRPFIMKPDGLALLFAPAGTRDAPLPAHYEPVESVTHNRLYHQQDSPGMRHFEGRLNHLARGVHPEYPVVGCTFRVTEHYLSGPMSRFNSWLNELMPAMFVELSPELAQLHGIENGGWIRVTSPRGRIEARALVTRRIKPMRVNGKTVHQIGVPFHWGFAGETAGGIANDLTSLVADPNVSMHEGKVFTCRVERGQPQLQKPTKKEARWANREPIPDTPQAAQPEGHLR
ncbi:MAG: molybdopterin-dependent oxidoreductase [Candidatus Eremiobacteraeota bacterium]|nr:molybdopterin-dependent oxidoreductase [Candidatus Eremiobacteraeota bacterium]